MLSCLAAPQADHLLHPTSQVGASRQGLPPSPENPHRGHQLLPGRGPSLQGPGCRVPGRAGHPHSRACPGGAVARLCSASMCHRPGECLSLRGLLLILKGWAWAELGKGPAGQNTGRLFYGQQTSVCRLTLAGHGVHGLAPSAPRPLFLPAHGGACGRMSPSLACPRFQPPKPGGVCGGPWVVTAGGSFRETGCPLGARASPCVSPSLIVVELRASASPSFPGPQPGPP